MIYKPLLSGGYSPANHSHSIPTRPRNSVLLGQVCHRILLASRPDGLCPHVLSCAFVASESLTWRPGALLANILRSAQPIRKYSSCVWDTDKLIFCPVPSFSPQGPASSRTHGSVFSLADTPRLLSASWPSQVHSSCMSLMTSVPAPRFSGVCPGFLSLLSSVLAPS